MYYLGFNSHYFTYSNYYLIINSHMISRKSQDAQKTIQKPLGN